jgi:cysteine desulfurase
VRHGLDVAREKTAAAIGAKPSEIVFTGSGSESDCLAIFGLMDANRARGNHFITSAAEHHAVLHAADALRSRGAHVTILPVDAEGFVTADALRAALTDKTVLVSIMHANNEIGTLQRSAQLAALAKERGALFHMDAVQTVGHIPVDVKTLGVDALSLSAHKFEGPKGCGALYVRKGVAINPILYGGGQEGGRRAGTENVAGIVGLATALDLAIKELTTVGPATTHLRDRLIEGVLATIPDTALNGARNERSPNNVSLRFDRIEGQTVVIALDQDGFEVSTGSACTSGTLEPSHVLTAIGLDPRAARGTVRMSLGRMTSQGDVDRLLDVLPGTISRLRSLASVLLA